MNDFDQQRANDVAELRRQFANDTENIRRQYTLLANQAREDYTEMMIYSDARALAAEGKLAYWMEQARDGGGGGGGGKTPSGDASYEEPVQERASPAVTAERQRTDEEERKRAKEGPVLSAVAEARGGLVDVVAGFDASSGSANTERPPIQKARPWKPTRRGTRAGKSSRKGKVSRAGRAEVGEGKGGGEGPSSVP